VGHVGGVGEGHVGGGGVGEGGVASVECTATVGVMVGADTPATATLVGVGAWGGVPPPPTTGGGDITPPGLPLPPGVTCVGDATVVAPGATVLVAGAVGEPDVPVFWATSLAVRVAAGLLVLLVPA